MAFASELLDELARVFARAAVDRFLGEASVREARESDVKTADPSPGSAVVSSGRPPRKLATRA